jgi:hypothetical protein
MVGWPLMTKVIRSCVTLVVCDGYAVVEHIGRYSYKWDWLCDVVVL